MRFKYFGDGCEFIHKGAICDVSLSIEQKEGEGVKASFTDGTGTTLQKSYRDIVEVLEDWIPNKLYKEIWEDGFKQGERIAKETAKREAEREGN